MKYFITIIIFSTLVLSCSDDTTETRKQKFILSGHGINDVNPRLIIDEAKKLFGEPIETKEEPYIYHLSGDETGDFIITMEYPNHEIVFFQRKDRVNSFLMSINGKKDSKYMYDIKLGIDLSEIINILGEPDDSGSNKFSYFEGIWHLWLEFDENNKLIVLHWTPQTYGA